MKKVLAVILVCVLIGALLVGCSQDAGTSSEAASETPATGGESTASAGESASESSEQASGEASGQEATGDPVKVGVTMPVTGPYANMGIPELEGIRTAAYVVNQNGGINGRPVELVEADVPDVAAAKGETDRLINQEGVSIVIGTYNSTLSLAVAETCNRYNTVYFETSSYGTAISRSGFTTTVRYSPNADQVGEILIQNLAMEIAPDKLGKEAKDLKIAFASEDGVWGTDNVNACVKLLEENGLGDCVKATEYYSADTKDLSTLILKLKAIEDLDILYLFAYEQDGILFVRQSKELGFDVPILAGGGGGLALAGFGEALGSMATGVISLDCPPLPPQTNEEVLVGLDEYKEAFQEVNGKEAYGIFGHTMYAGAMVMFNAMRAADSLETEDLMKAFYEVDLPEFQSTSGYGAKFEDEGEDLCKNTRSWPYLLQWQDDGKLYVIWPEEAAGIEPIIPKPAF